MRKKTFIGQLIISLFIIGMIFYGKNSENSKVISVYNDFTKIINKEITVSDVRKKAKEVFSVAKDAPSQVVSLLVRANEEAKYASPIDMNSKETVKQVHSVDGGMVYQAGNSKKLGLFVIIKHDEKYSTYGHLSSISVMPKERVQRGEIIGSYNSSCNEEFYYELEDDL